MTCPSSSGWMGGGPSEHAAVPEMVRSSWAYRRLRDFRAGIRCSVEVAVLLFTRGMT